MNILIFNWRDLKHSWAGGGEIYVFELAKRWVQKGHTVTVFCSSDAERDLPATEVYDGIQIVRHGNRYTVYFWAIFYYLGKRLGNPDIIIDVVNGVPFFTPFFSLKPKVAFIYHVHDRQFFYELPFPVNFVGFIVERYLFPILYQNVDIVAISKTTKDKLIKIGFSKKQIHVVYCGISKEKNNRTYTKYTSPTLLYLGRIKAYKRVDKLVELFEQLLAKRPNTKLVIAGWGTEASSVVENVMRSKYRKKIKLLGPVSEAEKKSLLGKAWVFVNLSIGEGWGISVIEANLLGTPAVSYDVPGLSESIIHGKTGFLANSDQELLDNILKILDNSNLRNRMGKEAKKWAESFDWSKTADETLKILEKKRKK